MAAEFMFHQLPDFYIFFCTSDNGSNFNNLIPILRMTVESYKCRSPCGLEFCASDSSLLSCPLPNWMLILPAAAPNTEQMPVLTNDSRSP